MEQLATSGASTHRIEQIGEQLSTSLGWRDVQIAILPSLLTVTFDGRSDVMLTRTITCHLGRGFSVWRMEEIDSFLEMICDGRLPPSMIHAVSHRGQVKDRFYGNLLNWLAVALLNGGSGLLFFGIVWQGAAIASVIGLAVIGPLGMFAARFPNFELVLAPISAFCAGFMIRSAVVLNLLSRECIAGTHLSSIVTFAPGIPLTIASLELASKSIVSGSSRLIASLFVAFSIGLGLNMGDELAGLFDPNLVDTGSRCLEVSLWWWFLAYPLVFASLAVIMDAPPKRWPVMFASASLAFFSLFGLSFVALSGHVKYLCLVSCVPCNFFKKGQRL